ncbi:MAG: peptidylprolyl isomerase [Rhodobacteraceae bacterium]|nr:peptidylprolyl isomerase [Paracoccaceae bacterium]
MQRTIIRILAVLIIAIAGYIGYLYLSQPVLDTPPPVPPAPVETPVTPPAADTTDNDAVTVPEGDILVIEVAGQANGVIEILLNSEIAPEHAARLKALAASGAYDNVIFHRVIDGFMAQTGDVQFGLRDGSGNRQAGAGRSRMPNLAAEFSDQQFIKGVVGMARGQNRDSANSQFFIMFEEASHLNGAYTVVGRVISGMDVVDAIKRGGGSNGAVTDPDYMKTVRVKAAE